MLVVLAGCGSRGGRARGNNGPAAAGADAGLRIRTVQEVPPPGTSAPDGSEVDVPLDWIYLVQQPAPTGSAPYAAAGVTAPCGFRVEYLTADRGDFEVRLRARARWIGQGPAPANGPSTECAGRTPQVYLVSLSVLRLGSWRVVDAIAPRPGGAAVTPRVQEVVPDDANLPPAAARWMRPCAADADCTAGGVCLHVHGVGLCAAPRDPWRAMNLPCPDGLREAPGAPVGSPTTRPVCVAACDARGQCAGALRCVSGACLPAPRG